MHKELGYILPNSCTDNPNIVFLFQKQNIIGMAPGNLEAKQNSRTKGSACRSLRLSLKMGMISWGQKQFNERLKKKEEILQRMEAKGAGERAETGHMREEVAEMVEAVEEKEAELELLRMLHNQLLVDLLHILEAEARLMEILVT